jgi:predicted MFS family arabinose efflux permease
MLMTGSLGMLASTLPVQWLLPVWGWRGLFWASAAGLMAAMVLILWWVPRDAVAVQRLSRSALDSAVESAAESAGRYRDIVRHPLFLRMAPLGFVLYGGLVAVQSLWAGPWLTRVGGYTAAQAAGGLFIINAVMLLTFMAWGALMPRLVARGVTPQALMAWGLPLALLLMVWIVALGADAGPWHWGAWCAACTFASVSQPAVAQAFDTARAGRALAAFNLVIFSGVFCVQWGLGLLTDALMHVLGLSEPVALRAAFGAFNLACALAYLWFLWCAPRTRAAVCP